MQDLLHRLRQEAERGLDIDLDPYLAAGRDPLDPVLLGSGSLAAPVGLFGRDPGRLEAATGEPFVGAGGRLVRDALSRRRHGRPCRDLDESVAVGRSLCWVNTVPYKPVGNKAWSVAIKRRFLPLVQELLVERWSGHDLITLGNVAFDWFRLADRSLGPELKAFWSLPDRYERSLAVELAGKEIRLHPLPHPSPLNATWYPRFPALMDQRLEQLGWA